MKYRFIADDYKEAIVALGLNRPEDWMRYSAQEIINDRTTETRRLTLPEPLPGCYAKIYRYPRWDDRLRILFRGGLMGFSRARAEFKNLRRLHRLGLSPRVLAYGRERKRGIQRVSLLVVEEVSGAVSLDRFIGSSLKSLSLRDRREFLNTLADFTKKMNTGGFVNGEYHWRNILINVAGGKFGFQVIDPSGLRYRYRFLYPYFDVATLDVAAAYFFTRSERLRFFKRYLGCSGRRLTPKQKKIICTIIKLRDKIARRELKRYQAIIPDNLRIQ